MKLRVLLMAMLTGLTGIGAIAVPAPTNSCFPHCHQCEVYVGDVSSRQILTKVQFSPLTGEEELTNQVVRIPGTKLVVIASVFYTDESMASKAGLDSMQLALAVSNDGAGARQDSSNAFTAPNNAVTEITLATFDTARVRTTVLSGSKRILIGMECKDKSSN